MAQAYNSFNSRDKLLHYPEKLERFIDGGKTLVVTELDLTNRCNNRCPGCTGMNQGADQLTWEEIQEIVRTLTALDNKGIILSGGGEPLMHPDFLRVLPLIKESGMKMGLNSNGLALTEEMAQAIARYCVYFRISLDAGTPEVYKATHGMEERAFDRVCDNIRRMADIKRKTGSELSFTTGFLTGPHTVADMESFVALSKELGADAAQFRPFLHDTTDISAEYHRLREKYEDKRFRVLWSRQKYEEFDRPFERGYQRCHGMFFSTVITANARMYACIHHRQDDRFLIGDLRAGEDLTDMWSYRKWLIYHDMDLSGCPPYCRNDSFSNLLEGLLADSPHKEFM